MKRQLQHARLWVFALMTLFGVVCARPAFAAGLADDTSFFTTNVPPNVLVVVDNSGSMNEIVWHPLYHPEAIYNTTTCPYVPYSDWEFDEKGNPKKEYWKCLKYPLCQKYTPLTGTQDYTSNTTVNPSGSTGCPNRSFSIFIDPDVGAAGNSTRWSKHYLAWYLSNNSYEFDVKRDPETGKILLDTSGKAQTSATRIMDSVTALNNGKRSACLIGEGLPSTYNLYRRSRITAAQNVLRDVICRANETGKVRFGLAKFVAGSGDPDGGFVTVPIDDYSAAQGTALENAIKVLEGEAWTPLSETLYHVYRYFMSRTSADLPKGRGTTTFPVYNRNVTTGATSGTIPPSPIQYTCQRNFVILLTDGEPTYDVFTSTGTSSLSTMKGLIGNYNADNADPEKAAGITPTSSNNYGEVWGGTCATGYTGGCTSVGWFLDDIAAYMQDNDARPDMAGVQNVEVYTVGFTTTKWANAILKKTAEGTNALPGARNGYFYRNLNTDDDSTDDGEGAFLSNGKFYQSNNAEELTDALNQALADILNKTQFFTAATVPATRTTANNNFYASFFKPRKDTQFWEGHVVNYSLYLDGSILDKNNDCALLDKSGKPLPILQCAVADGALPTNEVGWDKAFWDAGKVLQSKSPDPNAADTATRRTLYYSPAAGLSAGSTPPLFVEGTVTALDLGVPTLTLADVTAFQNAGSSITAVGDTAKLTYELVWQMRGCTFPTARNKASCTKRENMLGDVFHGNPLLVGPPSAPITDGSYREFKTDYKDRYDRLFVASNDGFVHAFDAGPSDDGNLELQEPSGHGNGAELWGFMPYEVRTRVKTIPGIGLANSSARSGVSDMGVAEYFVDGSPQAADVWLYNTPGDTIKSKTEWMTLLMGGMRQGGRSYYALDITGSVPKYRWEFPAQGAVSAMPGAQVQHMGESWSEPVITRIRVKYGSTNGGLGSSGRGYERWVAIFAGGYSVKSDPENIAYNANSNEGRAIFVVDVKTGTVLAQKYFKATPVAADIANGAVAEMKYAIASRPTVFDMDFDGYADVIYVGDLGGNVWKWIISPTCATALTDCVGDDTVNQLGKNLGQDNWKFELFFQAPIHSVDTSLATMGDNTYRGFYKPLTGAMVNRQLYLIGGTSNRANIGELDNVASSANNQRIFVLVDDAPRAQDYVRTAPATATSVPAIFGEQSLTGQPAPYSGYSVRMGGPVWLTQSWNVLNSGEPSVCRGNLTTAYAGYYITGEENEKFVTNPVVSLGRVMLGSYVPTLTGGATDPCLGGGQAYLWAFDVDCGASDMTKPDKTPTDKVGVGGGVPSDIVVSTGPDKKPNCSGLSGNLKKLCDDFKEDCQVKEYMVSGDGGLHNGCRKGRLDNKPRFRAWRVEK